VLSWPVNKSKCNTGCIVGAVIGRHQIFFFPKRVLLRVGLNYRQVYCAYFV